MIQHGSITSSFIYISAICDKKVNGLLLPLPNKWCIPPKHILSGLVANKQLRKRSLQAFTDGIRKAIKKVILLSSLLLCIQQAILGDEYGNGPHSSGTISFQRGRSGSAVRFD